jgi:DNA-binding LacI/PurR family transcriptional regulator
VGFDDLDFTAYLDVPLTPVGQPAFEIGETAVEMLARRFSDRVAGSQQIVLPTRLVVRRSCGAYLKDERLRETPR